MDYPRLLALTVGVFLFALALVVAAERYADRKLQERAAYGPLVIEAWRYIHTSALMLMVSAYFGAMSFVVYFISPLDRLAVYGLYGVLVLMLLVVLPLLIYGMHLARLAWK